MDTISTSENSTIREEILPNGDIYVGKFDDLVPDGTGKYIWTDGAVYEGEWDQGKISGQGRVVWLSGATYEGELRGGFLDGSGTFRGIDNSVYKGSWRMSKHHGMGTKTYSNYDFYEGFWKEGLQEGLGKYTWSNGNVYVGSWKAGKMNGRGVMKWSNGDLFNGDWSNGLFHGTGYYRYSDSSCYIGTWSKGLKDGHGLFYPPGTKLPSNQIFVELFGYNNNNVNNSNKMKVRVLVWILRRLFRRSPRISSGNTSVVDEWHNSCCNSSESDGGEGRESDKCLVYEREYRQGVLIMERVRTCDELGEMEGKKWRGSLWRRAVKTPSQTIYKGHKSYYLMLNLQLGIRYTVGKITPVPLREVRASDFGPRARIRMYFPREGTQYTPPHYSVNFLWKDYCPMVFRNLREMFKIDAADYMMSICGGDSLKELSSPGKSGSIFYLSQDERFVIKTLRKSELKILLKMLPKYYLHVGAHDNTLITKFFGLHRITLNAGRKVRFVVMGNMFCTELRIHRRYDLKGSSQGRFTMKQNINEKTTLKDLDLSHVFYVEKSWRESLFRQIAVDCMFLESQSIIDYSMLLGLHFRAPDLLRSLIDSQNNLPPDGVNLTANHYSETEETGVQKGFVLVAREPGSSSGTPGPHIRGTMLRVSESGDEEVDLVLPGTGRLRVQLGVNMPAQAWPKDHDKRINESGESDPFEVHDVVLYLGIIDILQEYNISKRVEHKFKSLKFDPLSISAVEPSVYSKRFIGFLESVFPVQQ